MTAKQAPLIERTWTAKELTELAKRIAAAGSRNVFPGFSGDDELDQRTRAAEPRGDGTLGMPLGDQVTDGDHVALREFRASGFGSSGVSPLIHHVLKVIGLGSEEQMPGVGASRVVATMKDPKSLGNRSHVDFVRQPVRQDTGTTKTQLPVARIRLCREAGPTPAVVRVSPNYHEPKEALADRNGSVLLTARKTAEALMRADLFIVLAALVADEGYTHGSLRGTDGRLEGGAGAETPVPPLYFTTNPLDLPINIADYRIAVGIQEVAA